MALLGWLSPLLGGARSPFDLYRLPYPDPQTKEEFQHDVDYLKSWLNYVYNNMAFCELQSTLTDNGERLMAKLSRDRVQETHQLIVQDLELLCTALDDYGSMRILKRHLVTLWPCLRPYVRREYSNGDLSTTYKLRDRARNWTVDVEKEVRSLLIGTADGREKLRWAKLLDPQDFAGRHWLYRPEGEWRKPGKFHDPERDQQQEEGCKGS